MHARGGMKAVCMLGSIRVRVHKGNSQGQGEGSMRVVMEAVSRMVHV